LRRVPGSTAVKNTSQDNNYLEKASGAACTDEEVSPSAG